MVMQIVRSYEPRGVHVLQDERDLCVPEPPLGVFFTTGEGVVEVECSDLGGESGLAVLSVETGFCSALGLFPDKVAGVEDGEYCVFLTCKL